MYRLDTATQTHSQRSGAIWGNLVAQGDTFNQHCRFRCLSNFFGRGPSTKTVVGETSVNTSDGGSCVQLRQQQHLRAPEGKEQVQRLWRSGICENQRERNHCRDCGGIRSFEHQRVRNKCKDFTGTDKGPVTQYLDCQFIRD